MSQSGALDVYGDSSYEADYYARYASNTTHTSDHQYSQYMSLQGSSQTANTQAGATQVGGYQQPHHATTPQSYTRGAVPCTQTYRPMYSSQYPNHQPSFRPENLTSGYNDVHIYGMAPISYAADIPQFHNLMFIFRCPKPRRRNRPGNLAGEFWEKLLRRARSE